MSSVSPPRWRPSTCRNWARTRSWRSAPRYTLGLAADTAAVTADFQRFLSLVIVDFGTGIRVAAPTSVLSSIMHAARSGIIIKSGKRCLMR